MEGIETEEQPAAKIVRNRATRIELMGFIKTGPGSLFFGIIHATATKSQELNARIKRHSVATRLFPLLGRPVLVTLFAGCSTRSPRRRRKNRFFSLSVVTSTLSTVAAT